MPEGPSIVILKEAVQVFKEQKVIGVEGSAKIDKARLTGQKIIDFKTWGKHLLICFPKFSIRIHLMLFGSYRINEDKGTSPRLSLEFKKGKLSFYASSVLEIDEPLDIVYDWSADTMNDNWDPAKAKKKLKALPDLLVCDALLDQTIFAGVGNIIKNEVLYRIRVHPKTRVSHLPSKQLNLLVKEARNYSFDFLKWKKNNELKKHWQAYAKKKCPRCQISIIKEYLGKTRRRSFFCNNCQTKY